MNESKQESMEDWLKTEEEQIGTPLKYEKKPTPKFEENKITTLVINASEPFQKWNDETNQKTKAIIPCENNGVNCNWWLNIKNPIYKDVVHVCREAKDKSKVIIKILQSGTKNTTQYVLIKE